MLLNLNYIKFKLKKIFHHITKFINTFINKFNESLNFKSAYNEFQNLLEDKASFFFYGSEETISS